MSVVIPSLIICSLSGIFAADVQPVVDLKQKEFSKKFSDDLFLNEDLKNELGKVRDPSAAVTAIYQDGLDIQKVQQTVAEIRAFLKFILNPAEAEVAWKIYMERSLVHALARYYEISTGSWNKKLLELTNALRPIFSAAVWEEVISHILEARLPMGIIKDKDTQLFTDYLPKSGSQSVPPAYPLENNIVTIYRDRLTPYGYELSKIQGKEIGTYPDPKDVVDTKLKYIVTDAVPVGYFVLMPYRYPEGLVIHVYGGNQASKAGTKKYTGNPSEFDKKLLKQGYAIAYLNLADLHQNNDFQTQIPELMFNKVLDGIKIFIDAVRNKSIDFSVDPLAELPIFLMGESFGGTTVTGFMRKYPGVVSGGITWNGALCHEARNEFCEPYLEPCNKDNLEKLQDPLLALQSWNDNRVNPVDLKAFFERAEKAGKKHLIHPFMIKMANEKVGTIDNQIYIGHLLSMPRAGDLDRVVQQVLSFLANPDKPSAVDQVIDQRRTNIIKYYASLNNRETNSSFEDILKGMTRKWYEERLKEDSVNRKDFGDEWINYYLPKYISLISKLATDTFEINTSGAVKKVALSQIDDLFHSVIGTREEYLWIANIKQLLKQELESIGLADYVNKNHVQTVRESIGKTIITKPFAARIGFEAKGLIYADKIERHPELESPELKRVKAQMHGWILGWQADSSKIWRKTLIDHYRQEKKKVENKKVQSESKEDRSGGEVEKYY